MADLSGASFAQDREAGSLPPLGRPPEFMALAERVAAGLPENPDFSDEWIEGLVDDLMKFED